MSNNFECRYMSIGGTLCFHYDCEIGLNDTKCNDCEINNNCEYCDWKTSYKERCTNCSFSEVENE